MLPLQLRYVLKRSGGGAGLLGEDGGGIESVGTGTSPFLALPLFTCHRCLCLGIIAVLGLCAPPHPIALSPVGNLSQAVENVLSVLLFYPEDEAAKEALNQYQAQLGEPRPGLGPREVPPPTRTL